MSETEGSGGRAEIWIEKFRPQTLRDVAGHAEITSRLEQYVAQDEVPNLLFSGPAGVGKTSAAHAIARELYGDDWRENFLELNASDERGIDVVRDRIKNFARSAFRGFSYRIIFLDEADSLCVPPGTEVVTGYPSKPEVKRIEEVAEDGEPIPSVDFDTNEIQSDSGKLVDSGVADFFEVELVDGRTIVASLGHPFFAVGDDGELIERELQDLKPGDEIADFQDDVGVTRCELCGDWTAGRFCSVECTDEGHSRAMHDPEIAQKASDALKGHEPAGRGNVRYEEEVGHLVRSDWEYEVAMARRDAGIEYGYEPGFELSDSVYYPDFLIGDTVIGVRGDVRLDGGLEKAKEFLEQYGDEDELIVIGDSKLPHHIHYEREAFDPAFALDGGRQRVDTVGIRRIDYSHRGQAYNITMDGTPNFMLANGILTHNTNDAQSALRRTMEQFSHNTRFILSCNYSSRIIDPIQSRCTVFRFSAIDDDAIAERVREIASVEGIEVTSDGVDAIVYAAAGDMRKAINALQAAAVMDGVVTEDAVYTITSTARPEEIESMVTSALRGDFPAARAVLDDLLTKKGLAGGDIITQLHRSMWDFDVDEEVTVRLLDRLGEADYRITEGANERVQLEALLAGIALRYSDESNSGISG